MQVTIYIRQDDEDKWKSLKDIPEFIHNALNNPDELTDPHTPPKTIEQVFGLKPEPLVANYPKPTAKSQKWSGPIYKKNGKL